MIEEDQDEVDEVVRQRGALISVVGAPTLVRTWDGTPVTSAMPFASGDAPFVGFSLIEAADIDEAVRLVAHTPCAVAGGALEIRPLTDPTDASVRRPHG